MQRRTRILIVDDHAIVRRGLRELFTQEHDLLVVGEASNSHDALEQCESAHPDVVLLDISLGQESGFSVIRSIRGAYPSIAILVLSMHDENVFAQRTLQSGANGYVGKHESSEIILHAVRHVSTGKTFVSEAVNDMILATLSGTRHGLGPKTGIERLSEREIEVLRHLGGGHKPAQIAEELGISVKTVETHRGRIKEKLGVKTSGELITLAVNWLRDGFLEKPSAT